MSEWVVVVDAAAGASAGTAERVRAALARWEVAGVVEVAPTRTDLADAVAAAARSGRRPAVVGGDATVAAAADALLSEGVETVLGVLPGPAASDLMRTFALPSDLDAATAHLRGDSAYRIDVAVAVGGWGRRVVVNDIHAGMWAAAVATAGGLPRSLAGPVLGAARSWQLATFPRAEVRAHGGRSLTGDAYGIVLANGQFFGGGWNVAPRALLVDGELDVQLVGGARSDLPRLAARMRRGTHLGAQGVRRRSMATVEVDAAAAWPVAADGEVVGTTPFRVEVVPGALSVKI